MPIAVILLEAILSLTLCSHLIGGFSPQPDTATPRAGASPKAILSHPEISRIAALEVKELLAKKADIVIVDTQPPENYEMWHIPTAVNIPYIPTANPTDREMMLVALPMDKLIVIYCLCEEGTDSARMALELKRLGYDSDKIKVLEGGLIKWDESGYPMIKQEAPQ